MNEELRRIYLDPSDPGSLGGERRLYKSALKKGLKVTLPDIRKFLKGEDAYTYHKRKRKIFPRTVTFVPAIDVQWQGDLSDLSKLEKENDGYRFLLFLIDVFSRFAFVEPLKDKTGTSILKALKKVFSVRQPRRLQTDKGSEFYNSTVKSFLEEKGIVLFSTENYEIKAAIVERLQRTMKEKMFAYFTATNTVRYVDILPSLVKAYNESEHRTIKMPPADVNVCNSHIVFENLYGGKKKTYPKNRKFRRGDYVRISKYKKVFAKGYESNWSREIFVVDTFVSKTWPFTYKVKDLNGEVLKGRFYEPELQAVDFDPSGEFQVDEILQSRGRGKKKEVLVSWKGYPESFNQWIPEVSLRNL